MKYRVGDEASLKKSFSASEVELFSELSGDKNPVHLDEGEAAKSIFEKRVVHGALTASLVSAVLGMQLPGPGTIYLRQDSRFLKPVYLDETVTATVRIIELLEKGRARLETIILDQSGEPVLIGEALVKLPESNKGEE